MCLFLLVALMSKLPLKWRNFLCRYVVYLIWVQVRVMVFNATFNNITVVLWPSVLLVEETGKTTDLSQVTNKLYLI